MPRFKVAYTASKFPPHPDDLSEDPRPDAPLSGVKFVTARNERHAARLAVKDWPEADRWAGHSPQVVSVTPAPPQTFR